FQPKRFAASIRKGHVGIRAYRDASVADLGDEGFRSIPDADPECGRLRVPIVNAVRLTLKGADTDVGEQNFGHCRAFPVGHIGHHIVLRRTMATTAALNWAPIG